MGCVVVLLIVQTIRPLGGMMVVLVVLVGRTTMA